MFTKRHSQERLETTTFYDYSNDFILLLIGWLFVLHYPTSVRLLAELGLIDQAFLILPKDNKIQALKEKSHIFMRYKTREPLI